MKTRKSAQWWLGLAIVLCLISMIGAGLIQNDFGRVKIVDVSFVTQHGTLTGYLLVPASATLASPAPAVVTSHGYLNNREMQDITYVELARRGFVVFAMDAYKHGDSSVPVDETGKPAAVPDGGMIDAVEYLHTLPFVDKARVGVTGHSMGGGFADKTMAYYSNLEKEALAAGKSAQEAHSLNKVRAGLIVGNVPSGLADGRDIMGSEQKGSAPYLADIGVIEGRYDEFAIALTGGPITNLFQLDIAKNFVALQTGDESYRAAPELVEGQAYRNASTGYGITFYSPWEIHPWNHFSITSARHTSDFFNAALGAPNPLPGTNQIWWLKEAFNLVGLAGFFMAVVPLAELLLCLPYFEELRGGFVRPVAALETPGQKRKFWAWGIAGGLMVAVFLLPLMVLGMSLVNPTWPQDTTSPIAVWAVGSGLIGLLVARLAGGSLRGRSEELGTRIPWRALFKTLLLAACVVSAAFVLVFAADYFFKTDFRFWSFDIRAFSASKIWVALKYAPFFVAFFLLNSLAVNRNRFADWSERKQIWVSILFNVLGVVIFLVLQYGPVLFTGSTFFGMMVQGPLAGALALIPILLFPFVPILAIAAFTGIKLYRLTGNIYLGGLVNGLLIAMITVANTSFTYPY